MATITLTGAFNTANFWAVKSGATIVANLTTYLYATADGSVISVSGTGFDFDLDNNPIGGTYTSITVTISGGGGTATYSTSPGFDLGAQFTAAAGLSASDTITGSTGNDTIAGGGGDDTINAGDGTDTAVFSEEAFAGLGYFIELNETTGALVVQDDEPTINDGTDTLTGIEKLQLGASVYDLTLGSSIGTIFTDDAGLDLIFAGGGNDTVIVSADGVDDGGSGGTGIDTLSFAGVTDSVTANLLTGDASSIQTGNDGYGEFENLIGGSNNDSLTGDSNANILDGGAGTGIDILEGGGGNDTLIGGENTATGDTAVFSEEAIAGAGYLIELNETTGALVVQDLEATVDDGTDTLTGIEKLQLGASVYDIQVGDNTGTIFTNDGGLDLIFAGGGNDTLTVSADMADDGGSGGSGIDTLSFAGITVAVMANLATGDTFSTETGDDGYGEFENLIGGSGGDTLTGNTVNNILDGGAGADSMTGGAGNDTYFVDDAGDTVTEAALGGTADEIKSTITITAALATEIERLTLLGAATANVTGNAFANTITGNTGNNIIDGGAGADTMIGDDGDDTYTLDNTADLVTELAGVLSGTDTIRSFVTVSAANAANVENFVLLGTVAVNVTGNALANSITGNSGKNTIDALGGNDTVSGGLGDDILKGGDGVDLLTYEFDAGRTSGVTVSLALTAAQTVSVTGTAPTVITEKDTITGFENLTGTSFADVLTGNAGINTILGLGGDDIIQGGAGADILDGGGGVNTVSYQASAAGVNINLANSLQASAGDAGGDTLLLSFQNVIGSAKTDLITGNDGVDNVIEGLGGADFLFGGTHGLLGDTVSYQRSAAAVNVNLATGSGLGGDAADDTIVGFENITGSKNNDTLTGNAGINVIKGGLGDDIIQGGAGADILDGGFGATALVSGSDTVSYAASMAGLTIDLTLATAQTSAGEASGDVLSNFENVIGGLGNDTLTGDGLKNTIDGGAGDDTIEGGLGDDILKGGTAGQDTLTYANSAVGVTVSLAVTTAQTTNIALGNPGKDTISGFERLTGSASFNDTLTGDKFDNIILGLGGDDTLQGGLGADTLDGGGGLNDTASYAASTLGVNVNLLTGVGLLGDAAGDTLIDIENLIGSAKADVLTGDGENNVIEGGAGADNLTGGGGFDTLSYERSAAAVNVTIGGLPGTGGDAAGDIVSNFESLLGSKFNDTLGGDLNANTIDGGLGNDTIRGGAGGDTLIGGAGIDTLSYSGLGGSVTVNLQPNSAMGGDATGDIISGFENILGSDGGDTLTGSNFVSTAINGANKIDGGAGDDTIDGGTGDDILIGGGVTGNLGSDWLSYASATAGTNGLGITVSLAVTTAQTTGSAGKDTISGFENLIGSSFDDVLTGSSVANTINGGDGNDVIQGGAAADTLLGGLGDEDIVSYAASTLGVLVNLGVAIQAANNGAAVNGDAAGDTLSGFEGIRGSTKADTLTGDAFDNLIEGGAGADRLTGGMSNGIGDVVSYEKSAAAVTVNLSIQDGTTAQTSGGDASGDILFGFENVLGSKGADTLVGDGGANILVGALGADKLTGGLGADTFLFEAIADKGDTILDFVDGTDKIGVDLEGFGIMSYNVQTGLAATVEGAVFVYDNTTGKLFYDADGSAVGAQVQIATLTGTNFSTITMSLLDFESF